MHFRCPRKADTCARKRGVILYRRANQQGVTKMANDAHDNEAADKEALRRIRAAEAVREAHISDAVRILSDWFIHAGVRGAVDTRDMKAAVRTAVQHIVDAATPTVTVNVETVEPDVFDKHPGKPERFAKLQPGERDDRD